MPDPPPAPANQPNPPEPYLAISASRDFAAWLAEQRVSLAVTTYQAGRLLLFGVRPADGRLAITDRGGFTRCMGCCTAPADARTLYLATAYQIWRLDDALAPDRSDAPAQSDDPAAHDRLYVPRCAHTTGDLDAHDLAIESTGRLVFVNTRYSCLATLSHRKSFTPLWHPPFISKLAPEDRCHLNGLALENGKAAYVTACSTTDTEAGWRGDNRRTAGVLLDLRTNQTILENLSMPHSPRVHPATGHLYLHNSGHGTLGRVDRKAGRFEPICFCPGYLRGLAFTGHYAVVGLSKPRNQAFTGLPLDDELAKRKATPTCGLQVIDLRTGQVAHWVKFEGSVSELYDVVALPGARNPAAIGLKSDDIHRTIHMDTPGKL